MPVWLTGPIAVPNRSYETLSASLTCDVLVIGAGIAGLHTAYELLQRGRQVVVIDDGNVCSGETGRTTAMLNSVPDDHLFTVQSMYGKPAARTLYKAMHDALHRMHTISTAEGIQCDWEWLDAHLIVGCSTSHADYPKERPTLDKEIAACHEAGFAEVRRAVMPPSLIPGIDAGEAVVYPGQAQYHPVKYINGLADAIVKRGGKIYTGTHAQEIQGGEQSQVVTLSGHIIKPRVIVQATNIPITNRVSIIDRLENLRTFLIAAEIPQAVQYPSLQIDDLEDPYHYIRTVKDGSGRNAYLLVGGEDHAVGVDNLEEQVKKFDSLESWMRERWPNVGRVVYQWTGQIQEPIDLLPLTGHNPHDADNVFIHTGDSGNGMIFGPVAGVVLADLITGTQTDATRLFDPKRKPIRAAGTYLKHGLEMGSRYRRWLSRGDVNDIEDIPRCEGAVVTQGWAAHVCVYKDEGGGVHGFNAVCPHLGAILKWNESEKSWDCPAHGSRWNRMGEIVNGPAKSNLDKVEVKVKA